MYAHLDMSESDGNTDDDSHHTHFYSDSHYYSDSSSAVSDRSESIKYHPAFHGYDHDEEYGKIDDYSKTHEAHLYDSLYHAHHSATSHEGLYHGNPYHQMAQHSLPHHLSDHHETVLHSLPQHHEPRHHEFEQPAHITVHPYHQEVQSYQTEFKPQHDATPKSRFHEIKAQHSHTSQHDSYEHQKLSKGGDHGYKLQMHTHEAGDEHEPEQATYSYQQDAHPQTYHSEFSPLHHQPFLVPGHPFMHHTSASTLVEDIPLTSHDDQPIAHNHDHSYHKEYVALDETSDYHSDTSPFNLHPHQRHHPEHIFAHSHFSKDQFEQLTSSEDKKAEGQPEH